MFFPALDSIVKEKAFGDARQKLGGQQLDIFVVNSFSSGFQVCCQLYAPSTLSRSIC